VPAPAQRDCRSATKPERISFLVDNLEITLHAKGTVAENRYFRAWHISSEFFVLLRRTIHHNDAASETQAPGSWVLGQFEFLSASINRFVPNPLGRVAVENRVNLQKAFLPCTSCLTSSRWFFTWQ
jgi:hypothetical protein